MIRRSYVVFVLKSHRGFALFSILVIGALQYLIIQLMTTLDTQAVVGNILNELPDRFKMIVNENFITRLSPRGAAAFGFNHPIVLALLAINAISIPTRHVAGEIESGTMEWLLAQPVRRGGLMLSLWVTGILLVFLLICGAWAGSFSAMAVTHNFSAEIVIKMIQIGTNLWLLFVLIMSLAMMISAFGKEGGRAGMRAAAITLVFYLLHFLSTVWESLAVIKPYNIFTYYQPQKLMFGERSFSLNAFVLLVLIGLMFWIGMRQFQRRDIPG
jgi:ABC-type transport system involved in multi-copper enzyme maturation permease subunit